MGVCNSVVVGQPYSTCFDIAKAAGIAVSDLTTWNPGLNCNTLQLGQRICVSAGSLTAPNSDGSCEAYKIASGDSCYTIGLNFGTNATALENWNKNTYHWKGCSKLDVGLTMCVSSGTPPPVPVNPDVQCGPESSGNLTCPLNGCCSAFGYCGTTSDFCSAAANGDPCNSNCFIPTLPSCPNGNLGRKVGYYAGWAARRPCQAVSSKQASLDGLTHVIYAFATISSDMQIVLAADDVQPLKDLVARKGSTKVMIAVGGWTFSQEDPTKPLFTTMIGSSANRATFIASTKSFLSQYGVDGVDVDMEYPASVERGGPPSDTPNLTAFFKELRAALPSTIISIASPAGYWFMRGYQMDKIAPSVSFINLMAYDYHGPWDLSVQGEDQTAKPHTSLQDIKDSVLLYTRIGINMAQVNLGTAYYGRTFKLADSSCGTYGCKFTAGGANGTCTGASGVLSFSELSRLSGFKNAVYDQSTQTKHFMQGSDLVTFDDKDTWAAKTSFAAQTCFGGTMAWSIDQVDPPPTPTPTQTPTPTPTSTTPVKPSPTGKPCTEVKSWAQDMLQSMWDSYEIWNPGPIFTQCGCFHDVSDLWIQLIGLEAVVNWMAQTGTTDYDHDLIHTSKNTMEDFGLPAPGYFANSHDDALWGALLYMRLGDFQASINSPFDGYWSAAMAIVDYVAEDTGHHLPYTSDKCDGGVWWTHDKNDTPSGYKNAITNALFIQASAKAYMKGYGDKYLKLAQAAWGFSIRIRDDVGLFTDGTNSNARVEDRPADLTVDCDQANTTRYTYNQGTMVAALGALYKATGDKNYINEGLITIDAVISHMTENGILREDCDIGGNICNRNGVNFKGLCLRHFSYFFDYIDDPSIVARYSDWLGEQAKAIHENAHDSDGEVLSVWCEKDSTTSSRGFSDIKRSALDGLLAAMKYGTC